MCGIFSFEGENTDESIEIIKNLLIQSSYRGQHSTGIVYEYFDEVGGLYDLKRLFIRGSSKEFLDKFDIKNEFKGKPKLRLIAQTRYSTSGEACPPFIFNDGSNNEAIVLNGVIDQSDPNTWEEKYEEQFETDNDIEIYWRCSEKTKGSFAALEMVIDYKTIDNVYGANYKIIAKRNGTRPLYSYQNKNYKIYCSTKSMLTRSGIKNEENIIMLDPIDQEQQYA